MAKLWVTEYQQVGLSVNGGNLATGQEPYLAETRKDYSSGAQSMVFGDFTRFVRVHTDAVCHIRISAAGTAATASNKRLSADQTEYFGVVAGDTLSVLGGT